MDRELVFLVLMLLLVAPALLVTGAWSWRTIEPPRAQQFERVLWRQLWLALVPAGLLLAMLVGWAVLEPENAERLPAITFVCAFPFGVIWLRAVARALVSLRSPGADIPALARGILWPRVVVAPRFAAMLDEPALRAVLAHENAHARGFDPLRIWVAQFVTDLQWPCVGSRDRFHTWLRALEMARDEEVRDAGVEGADLAKAILVAARFGAAGSAPGASAPLGGRSAEFRLRIERLLAPLPPPPVPLPFGAVTGAFCCGLVVVALVGATWGEAAMQVFLRAVQ